LRLVKKKGLVYPWMELEQKRLYKEEKLETRKLRIMMKGMKIGVMKGGQRVDISSIVSKLK
jgi:hypothetical protein